MRSSRDRIARSTVVNLIVLTAVLYQGAYPTLLTAMTAIAALISIAMWVSFEGVTFAFETHAYGAAMEKQPNQASSPNEKTAP